METFITHTLEFLKGQSIQVAIVFVGVLILTWLLQNKSAHVRYLLWLLVAIKCLTPPLVIFSVPVLPAETIPVILPPQNQTIEHQAVPIIIEQPKSTETVTVTDKPQQTLPNSIEPRPVGSPSKIENTITSTGVLLSAWAAGAACYLLWALGKAVRLGMCLRRIRKPLPAQLMIEQIEKLAQLWNYPGGFKVWLVDGINQPFVWGLWRGAIYLPTRFQNIQGDKQKAIVLHEMAHVVRFDAFVNLIQILIQGVFWFHPFVWLANKSIRQEREKCCDEIAVARLGTAPKEYGSAIVDTLLQETESTVAIPTLAVAGPVKNIEDRIKTIMQPGRRFFHRPSTIALLVIGLLAAVTIPTTIALTQKPTPPDYTLSGSVTNAESGQPIAGAIVFDDGYGPEPYQKGITDEGGKFEYKSWNEEHNIAAKADGYKSQGMTFTTFPFDNSKNLNFKLQPVFSSLKVEAGKSGPPFIAALPDGVTVELLGICEDVSQNKWWKPDGTVFTPEKFVLKENGVNAISRPYHDRIFLAKITGPDGMNCGFGKILGSIGMLSLQIEDSSGQSVPDLFAYKVHLDTSYELTDITVRVAAGAWKTIAAPTPGGGVWAQGADNHGITFAGVIEKDGKIIVTASDDFVDMNHHIVAIDEEGKEHFGPQPCSSAGKTRLTTAEFKNLALDRIKEFQFRVRPYQEVEFKNVSLKPNLKTDVKVEILPLQDGTKQNQARAMEIFDNPKFKKRFFVTIAVDKNNEISGDGQKVTAEQFEAIMPQCPDPAHTVLEVAFEPGAFPDIHTQYKNNPVFQKAGQWVEKYHLEYLSYVGEDHPENRRGPLSIRIEDAFETDKVIAVGMPAVDLNADKPLLTVNTIVFSSNYSNVLADISMAVISHPKRQWEIKVRLLDKDGRQIDSIVHNYQKSGVILGAAAITNETLTFNFGTLELSKIAKFEIEVRQMPIDSRQKEDMLNAMNQIKQVAVACLLFAADNVGPLPQELGQLKPYLPENNSIPLEKIELLQAGRKLSEIKDVATTALLRMQLNDGKDGAIVAFCDGHVEYFSPERMKAELMSDTFKSPGSDVIEIKTDSPEKQLLLGPNGTGYFDRNCEIHIGDIMIKVDRRIQVINTGSDVIEIKTDSPEKQLLLGPNGTGYFDRNCEIHIGDIMIKVDRRIQVINTGSEIIKILYYNDGEKPAEELKASVTDSNRPAISSPFTAVLPNDVTVELVGICEYPSQGKQWWKPDGSPLSQQIITQDNSNYEDKNKAYEIAYRISIPQGITIDMPRVKGSIAQSGLEVTTPDDLKAIRTHLDLWGNTTEVSFPIAAGPWETLGSTNGTGMTSTPVGNRKLMFSPAAGSRDKLILTVTDDLQQFDDYRLIAIDKSGNTMVSNRGWFSQNNLRQNTFTFTSLNPVAVDHYEFQSRPFANIQFKNVSLKPGKKTDVKIEIPEALKKETGRLQAEVWGVVSKQGKPQSGCRIIATVYSKGLESDNQPKELYRQEVLADNHGYYQFKNLPAGKLRIAVMSRIGNLNEAQKIMSLSAGQKQEINFGDEAGHDVTGMVLLDGKAVELAGISIVPESESSFTKWGWTARDGTFGISGIPAGNYKMIVDYNTGLNPNTFTFEEGKTYLGVFEIIPISEPTKTIIEIYSTRSYPDSMIMRIQDSKHNVSLKPGQKTDVKIEIPETMSQTPGQPQTPDSQKINYPKNWDEISKKAEQRLRSNTSSLKNEVYDCQSLINYPPKSDCSDQKEKYMDEYPWEVIDQIQNEIQQIAPESWDRRNGEGTIRPIGETQLLIWQTPEMHEQIRTYLDNKTYELLTQIDIEVRMMFMDVVSTAQASLKEDPAVGVFITAPADSREVMKLLEKKTLVLSDTPAVNTLDDSKTKFIQEIFKQSKNVRQLTAPKGTTKNKKSLNITIMHPVVYIDTQNNQKSFEKGFLLEVLPEIAEDRKSVCLAFRLLMTDLVGPKDNKPLPSVPVVNAAEIQYTCVIPDQQTFWLVGPEGYYQGADGTTSVSPTKQRLLIQVKPTIVMPEEQNNLQRFFENRSWEEQWMLQNTENHL